MKSSPNRVVNLNACAIPRLKRRAILLRTLLILNALLVLWFAFVGDGASATLCFLLGFINTVMLKRNQSLLRTVQNVFTLKT